MPEQSNDYRVVVFGAGGVGKSSLVLRFVKGTFRDTYIPTVEDTYRQVDTHLESLTCSLSGSNVPSVIVYHIWSKQAGTDTPTSAPPAFIIILATSG